MFVVDSNYVIGEHLPTPTTIAKAAYTDPAVAKLLDQVKKIDLAEFLDTLENLAKKRGWKKELEDCKNRSFHRWEEARAVPIQCMKTQYVVVLLKSWTHTIPGSDKQTVILLDNQGKFLDQLACDINARLSHMQFGTFHTVIPTKPEPDGARLVIRLDGESARGNFTHHIYHGGREGSYDWGRENQPTKWDIKGLCRVAVNDGKLKVLFPAESDKMQKPGFGQE